MFIYFYFYKEQLIYIGSCKRIKKRIGNHKSDLKKGLDKPFYNYLRDKNLTLKDLEIELN